MKKSILLFVLSLIMGNSFSQSLEGEWKGNYVREVSGGFTLPKDMQDNVTNIRLQFVLNNDSSYTVYSYTKLPRPKQSDTTVICKLIGFINSDSAYLEEVEIIAPAVSFPSCYQRMYLKIVRKKKFTELRGEWESTGEQCQSSGTISFRRKNE